MFEYNKYIWNIVPNKLNLKKNKEGFSNIMFDN